MIKKQDDPHIIFLKLLKSSLYVKISRMRLTKKEQYMYMFKYINIFIQTENYILSICMYLNSRWTMSIQMGWQGQDWGRADGPYQTLQSQQRKPLKVSAIIFNIPTHTHTHTIMYTNTQAYKKFEVQRAKKTKGLSSLCI